MKFTFLSLFPGIIDAYFSASITAKAVERGVVEYECVNIRDFAADKHKTCDDAPYGGGAGMLLLAGPLSAALRAAGCEKRGVREEGKAALRKVIYLSPSGRLFNSAKAKELADCVELVMICGRYEGIDERVVELYVDEEICVGDYVMSSGEIAALTVADTVQRLVGGVIAGESLVEESFTGGLLEYPQWTRPEIFDSVRVPEVLLSGHHERIRRDRLEWRLKKTMRNRPDLIEAGIRAGSFDKETVEIIKRLTEGDIYE